MRLKAHLILLFVLLLTALPIAAQEDSDSCDIQLLDVISELALAQIEADTGNTGAALELIAEIEAQLTDIAESCEGGNNIFERFSSDEPVLPKLYVVPGREFSFRYPDDWSVQLLESGFYGAANDPTAFEVFSGELSDIQEGQQVVFIVYIEPEELLFDYDEGMSLAQATEILRQQLAENNDGVTSITTTQPISIGDRDAFEFSVSGENFGLGVITLDYLAENRIALLLSISDANDAEAVAEILLDVAESFSVPAEEVTLSPPGESIAVGAETEFWQNANTATATHMTSLGEDFDFGSIRTAQVSPDGETIMYFGRDELCLYRVASTANNCYPIPETFGSAPTTISWSPDGNHIAFTEDFYRRFDEPDIWVFDVENTTFVNLTPDGQDEAILRGGESTTIDFMPTWHPDGSIYFLRSNRSLEFNMELHRLTLDGEVTFVRDLSGEAFYLSIFDFEVPQLGGALEISPDGELIAFMVVGRSRDHLSNGIWIMETSGEEAPRQIAGLGDFLAGQPPQDEDTPPSFPEGLAWTADNLGLFVIAGQRLDPSGMYIIPYYIDLTTNAVTPLIDFSAVDDSAFFTETDPITGLPYDALRIDASVVPAGSDRIFAFGWSRISENPTGYLYTIDREGNLTVLTEIPEPEIFPFGGSTAGSNGNMILFAYLFNVSE